MNGIEKITARIAADADVEIGAIQAESAARCAEIRAEYEKKAQEEYWALVRAGVKDTEQRVQRLARTAGLEAKKSVLALKQEIVSKAFDFAKEKIAELPEPEYVAFLAGQASQASRTGQEEILLNKADRARVGAKVVKAANELLQKRGLKPALTLGESVSGISGGLVLKQGDIEVNCTIYTLLELSRAELAAQVAEVLFA
jgi:V/A-type H+-transporting ATPase subunit E